MAEHGPVRQNLFFSVLKRIRVSISHIEKSMEHIVKNNDDADEDYLIIRELCEQLRLLSSMLLL